MWPIFLISSMDLSFRNRCILTDASDRIARAFNRSGATQTVLFDISKAFHRVWLLVFVKYKSHKFSAQIFGLISSFLSNKQLGVVLDGKSSQEYPVHAFIPQGSVLGHTLFLLFSYHFSHTFLL